MKILTLAKILKKNQSII